MRRKPSQSSKAEGSNISINGENTPAPPSCDGGFGITGISERCSEEIATEERRSEERVTEERRSDSSTVEGRRLETSAEMLDILLHLPRELGANNSQASTGERVLQCFVHGRNAETQNTSVSEKCVSEK